MRPHRTHGGYGLAIAVLLLIGAGLYALLGQFGWQSWRNVPHATDRPAPLPAGIARVIDGDTLEIGGKRIRLHGIDAPERRQSCEDAGGNVHRHGWVRRTL